MNLKIYRAIQFLLSPLIGLYLKYRKIIGKEDKKRFSERLGKASVNRPNGSLIWIHAASIGEAVSVLPLLEAIKQKYSDINILITTGTVTSAKLISKRLPRNIIHQFIPVDIYSYVKRFLDHWRPNLAIWVESEIWPNLVCETALLGCPMVLVNARMSSETLAKWKRRKNFADVIFGCFSLCLAQNQKEAEKFVDAGIKNTFSTGNLKYEALPLPADPDKHSKIVKSIGDRMVFLAASTYYGEDEIIAKVHKKLVHKYSNLLTIIVPRHPQRANDIKKMLISNKIFVSQRSKNDEITNETDIYLADTIGELGMFYRIAGVVFVGGSLVDHGGQNPLEPARLDCAILSGQFTRNFSEIYSEMEKLNAVQIVKDENDLVEKSIALLGDNQLRSGFADRAMEYVQSKSGIIDKYMEYLDPYLKPLVK